MAAIDIGSRNVKLVVGDLVDRSLVTRFVEKTPLELGEDVAAHGMIRKPKLAELRDVLATYRARCAELDASLIGAIATSAVRNTQNRLDVFAVTDEFDVAMEIIEGDREAVLGYYAATGGAENALVSDLGSRSCGIAWHVGERIETRSTELGHATAYRRFFHEADTWVEAETAYRSRLAQCFGDLASGTDRYIALTGKTLAGFVFGCDKDDTVGARLSASRLRAKIEEIRALSSADFKSLLARTPKGAKIASAMVFVDYLLERSGHVEAQIQDTELPAGLIVEHIRNTLSASI